MSLSFDPHTIQPMTEGSHFVKLSLLKSPRNRIDWHASPLMKSIDSITVNYGVHSRDINQRASNDEYTLSKSSILELNDNSSIVVEGFLPEDTQNSLPNSYKDFLAVDFRYRIDAEEYRYSMFRPFIHNKVNHEIPETSQISCHEIIQLCPPRTGGSQYFPMTSFFSEDGAHLPSSVRVVTELVVKISDIAVRSLDANGLPKAMRTLSFETSGRTHYRDAHVVGHYSNVGLAPLNEPPLVHKMHEFIQR